MIPEKYYLATGRGGSKINDERVIQIFENSDALDFGAEMIAYGAANAQAKVCQDVILKAISASSLSRNVTIKGGVVMRIKLLLKKCKKVVDNKYQVRYYHTIQNR